MTHSHKHERIVVVHNPNSTRANKVHSGVFNRLDEHDISYVTHATNYPDAEANIADMQQTFRNGDTVLSVGGDGTAMQVANGVLRNQHADTAIGVLGYGNFRDLGKEQDPLKLLDESARVAAVHPLTIEVNDTYLRDAPGYMSLGFTALIASRFGTKSSRERLKAMPEWTKLLASIGQVGLDYFALRNQKIPAFHTDLSPTVEHAATDLFALNSPQAGSVIRSATDYGRESYFGFRTNNVSSVLPNIPFGIQALLGHAPARTVEELTIHFEEPSTVPFQTEGEFVELTDVNKLFIYKDPAKTLRMLRSAT